MKNTSAVKEVWEMPEWMESYREFITNTGGNSVEKLMNLPSGIALSNEVLSAMGIAVDSQISMLIRLKNANMLRPRKPATLSRTGEVLHD